MIQISDIGVPTAFAAGVISFLSPCVLPLVPGYLSYVAGSSVDVSPNGVMARRWPAVGLSMCFVLGFSTVFVILGASATALGQLLLSYRQELNVVSGSAWRTSPSCNGSSACTPPLPAANRLPPTCSASPSPSDGHRASGRYWAPC
jgi:cytochrome c biogenesis protein CcdA